MTAKPHLMKKDAVYLVNEEIARPFPGGFSEKLVGLSVDEPAEFDLDIPEDFPRVPT
ncbi:MAG: hypothetical protein CM1200mP3_13500 [Chloroflexota bacterium]|nr:MAG: hypothetical protein CM1200mP3_13500 [Chloroflexota bacterium]